MDRVKARSGLVATSGCGAEYGVAFVEATSVMADMSPMETCLNYLSAAGEIFFAFFIAARALNLHRFFADTSSGRK
jgi:hypothetical protein